MSRLQTAAILSLRKHSPVHMAWETKQAPRLVWCDDKNKNKNHYPCQNAILVVLSTA
jgi:hypothetical protein